MRKIKITIIIILMLTVSKIYSQQSLVLSFEAKHYEGESVRLDSILIKNITRNCDTILYAPDTILYYNFYVGTKERETTEQPFRIMNFPNPTVNNETTLDITLNKSDKIKLQLFDIYGRILLSYSKLKDKGRYKFLLTLPKSGYYFLKVGVENKIQTIKIINNSAGKGVTGLKQVSYASILQLKSKNRNGNFWYEPGDTLWYVGYAKTPYEIQGSAIVEDVPQNSGHYLLTIVEGLPCENIVAVKYHGHLYPTVQIDGNCWFKENLNIGTMIPGDTDMEDNGIIEKYCYDNDTNNCNNFGGLYQWNELMNYSEEEAAQGICPEGWHVPTSDEMFSLIEDFDGLGCKERGNKHWLPGYNVGGSNVKGFTALGAGYRQNDKLFYQLKTISVFFSSTELPYNWVWYMELNKNNHMGYGTTLKITGNSVRCIKDQ